MLFTMAQLPEIKYSKKYWTIIGTHYWVTIDGRFYWSFMRYEPTVNYRMSKPLPFGNLGLNASSRDQTNEKNKNCNRQGSNF